MAKVLVRLSIPPRLRDGMMLKEGYPNTFDVPNTKEGAEFLAVWNNTSTDVRDKMMKRAYDESVPIVSVKPEDVEEESGDSLLPGTEDVDEDEDDEEDD